MGFGVTSCPEVPSRGGGFKAQSQIFSRTFSGPDLNGDGAGRKPAGNAVKPDRSDEETLIAMIKYKEIAFTAYAVTNMARAKKFYEGVLGLKPTRVFSKNFIEYDIGSGTLV